MFDLSRNDLKKFIILLFLIILSCNPFYSASKKSKKKSQNEKIQTEITIEATFQKDELEQTDDETVEEMIKLPVQKRTFFYKIDEQIIKNVENGSPESLKNAMQMIKKTSEEYEENEKVLITIASEIMKTVWPSQKITWEQIVSEVENPYTGAINSAKQGIFDSSTGDVDFLTTLLPALVILNPVILKAKDQSQIEDDVFVKSKASVEKAIEMNPDSVLANYLMGVLLGKQKKNQESLFYLNIAYQNSPKTEEISLRYADALYETGDYVQAQNVINNLDPMENNISVLKQKAYIAFELKDYDNAERFVALVLQQNPNDLDFLLFRAKILVEKKDYIRAVSLLDVYARQNDKSLDYLILRAKIQLDWSKNTTAATETIEKALQLYPDDIQVLMIAAKISSITDSPVAGKYADQLTEKVLQTQPDNTEAMIYSLNALIQRENWIDSYKVCRRIIETDNYPVEIVVKFVSICLKLGKNNEAFDFAKNQLAKYPDDETVLQAYVFAYSKVGNRELVLKYIDSLLANTNQKMKSYLFYVRSFLQVSDEKALADLRSSLSMNPRNSDSLFRLYEIYYEKQDYRKAQYYLRQVVAINPNNNSLKKLNESLTKLIP